MKMKDQEANDVAEQPAAFTVAGFCEAYAIQADLLPHGARRPSAAKHTVRAYGTNSVLRCESVGSEAPCRHGNTAGNLQRP